MEDLQTSVQEVLDKSKACNYSPELLHVDGRDTCCDQEGWIKRSESENIQSNLIGGFLGLECGTQSVVATANRKTLLPWNKSIVQILILQIRTLHQNANSETIGNLRIRIPKGSANSCPTSNCEFERYWQSANSDNEGIPVNSGNACPLTRNTTTTEAPLRKQVVLDNETSKPAVTFFYSRKPRNSKTNVPVSKSKVVQIVLWYLDSGCSKHMTGDRSQLTNFVNKFLGTVKFRNDHVAKILGYGDYQIRESRYDIKGFTMWKDLDTTYSLLGSFVIQTLRLLFVNMPASLVI
ncbi:hypothetical protein Tco_0424645 [Tanacetum coccineum]